MKLSADIIFEQLMKRGLAIEWLGRSSKGLAFKSFLFYEEGMTTENNQIYLATANKLPAIPPKEQDVLFIYVGQVLPKAWHKPDCDMFFIRGPITLTHLFNLLQTIFTFYSEWDDTLRHMLENDANIDQMLLCGSEMLDNPIYVSNKNMEILSASGYSNDQVPHWFLFKDGNIPIEHLSRIIKQHKKYRDMRTPFLHDDDGHELIYSINIFSNNELKACVSLSSLKHPISEADYSLFRHYVQYIEKALHRQQRISHTSFLSIKVCLHALLDGADIEEVQLLSALNEIPFIHNDSRLTWLCFVIATNGSDHLVVHEYIVSNLLELIPDCICFAYGESVILLMQLADDDTPVQTVIDKINPAFSDAGFEIGISDRFKNIRDIRVAYDKACYAIKLAQLAGRKEEAHFFSNYALAYLMLHSKGIFKLKDILPSSILKLMDHDENSKVSYVNTLWCYLRNQRNIAQTARELFLHRSTLIQRLERIFKMLNTRLETSDENLYYSILLRLLEYERGENK